ncbi:MAG: orotate phosphoribosyltransferase [Leptospiraceae bacterium]|nr:orotate phosphoribosyltransferase [Leptospiraceae bacterium]MDW8307155.1 orotate phosphoribosyltransferase [Leptospiraceae bacterium]
MAERQSLREAILRYSYRENHEEPFVLASGKKSPYYLDLKQTLLQPTYLWQTAALFFELMMGLPKTFKGAGGLTMGADPLAYALSLYAQTKNHTLYPVIVRKESKAHGTTRMVEAYLPLMGENAEVLLLDDVVTTGMSSLKALRELKKVGLQVHYCFCVVDREEGGRENLKEEGVELYSLFTLSQIRRDLEVPLP